MTFSTCPFDNPIPRKCSCSRKSPNSNWVCDCYDKAFKTSNQFTYSDAWMTTFCNCNASSNFHQQCACCVDYNSQFTNLIWNLTVAPFTCDLTNSPSLKC